MYIYKLSFHCTPTTLQDSRLLTSLKFLHCNISARKSALMSPLSEYSCVCVYIVGQFKLLGQCNMLHITGHQSVGVTSEARASPLFRDNFKNIQA